MKLAAICTLFSALLSAASAQSDPFLDLPKENPEKVYVEMKLLQTDGSAYRVPKEDWAGAKRRISTDAKWQAWYQEQRKTTDEWIALHQDKAGWEAGWNHDFVSPTDGAWLIWTENIPVEGGTILSKSGEKVTVTPAIFRSWVGTFRKKHTDLMTDAARMYRLTGEVRYAEWVASQLDFYADNYKSWESGTAKRSNSWLGHQTLDDAIIVTNLIESARLIFDWASPERRDNWYSKLFKPEADLLEKSRPVIHNIAMWLRSAEAQIALLYKDEEMWKRAVDSKFGIRNQFRYGVTSDYFWYEQSMGYNEFILVATEPLFTFAGLTGHGDRLRHEAAIAQNLMLSNSYIRFPNRTIPNPADNTGIAKAPSSSLKTTYRILPTTLGIARSRNERTWSTLIDPPEEVAGDRLSLCTETLPEVTSRNMESSRFAVLKKDPWQVFFHYGQLVKSHAQSEALNWSATFNGIDITHDPGTVGYSSPLSKDYYRMGLNHNIPLINGEGQLPNKPGKLLQFDATAGIVSAEQPDYREGVSARRTLKIEGQSLVDVCVVTASKPSKLGLALHLQGTPKLPATFKPVGNFEANRPPAFHYWHDVRSATFTDRAEIDVTFGDKQVLTVRFSTPGTFTIYQGSSPDQPPARRAAFYIEKEGDLQEAEFTTQISPADKK